MAAVSDTKVRLAAATSAKICFVGIEVGHRKLLSEMERQGLIIGLRLYIAGERKASIKSFSRYC